MDFDRFFLLFFSGYVRYKHIFYIYIYIQTIYPRLDFERFR